MNMEKILKAFKLVFDNKIPQAKQQYQPTPYLKHHFLQSFYELQSPSIHVEFQREKVFFMDGGHVSLDWVGKQKGPSTKSIIVIMHGMTGGSETKYIRALAVKALKNNYTCVCINGRGINSEMTSPIPFLGYGFHELSQSIKRIHINSPDSSIHIIGTSLGGNFVLRYLLNNEVQFVKSLSLISAPFDLKYVIDNMHPTYQRFFIKSYIENSVCRHKEMHFWWENNIVNLELLKASKSLRDFHERITIQITGYDNVDKLLQKFKINNQQIQNFKLKTFILSSEDDPMVHFKSIPIESINKNKNIKFLSTKYGGHLCWFQGISNPQRWYPKPVFQFINSIETIDQINKNSKNIVF